MSEEKDIKLSENTKKEEKNKKPMKKKKKWSTFGKFAFISVVVFFFVSVLLFISEIWLFDTWESLSIDEIVYHLSTTIEGTNPDMIWNYIFGYGIWAVVIITAVAVLLYILHNKKRKIYKICAVSFAVLSLGLLVYTVADMNAKLQLFAYVSQELGGGSEDDYIKDRYVSPCDVKLKFPKKKRNLIYIYMESMEMSYADKANGGAFEENYIPELTQIAKENECFNGNDGKLNGGISLPGTTWTMGALFGQSSGLPLKISIGANRMNTQEDFFKGVISLGDILKGAGYNQSFMIGSEAKFGGRDLYYKQHGDYAIRDYNWAKEKNKIDRDYHVFWGYEDEKLYSFAKEQIMDLDAKDEPFNFTMLTVDTHFEDGYVCRLCGKEHGDDQYANVISCASRQVSEFLSWIKQQDFYENTTIVINGDHPTMDKDFFENVTDYQRKTYTAIINGAVKPDKPELKREYSTIDMYPTTLAAMGVKIPGGYLGLGANLYDSKAKTLLEKEGLEKASRGMSSTSPFMNQLAGVSIDEKIMERVRKASSVVPRISQENTVDFRIRKVSNLLNYNSIDKVLLRLEKKDPETGTVEDLEYKAVIEQMPNNPTKYKVICKTDIPFTREELSKYTGQAYIWVEGFEEYPLGQLELDEVSEQILSEIEKGNSVEESTEEKQSQSDNYECYVK